MRWSKYCGVVKLGLYSSAEGEQAHAKGATKVYERVQVGSRTLGANKRQAYQPGRTRPGYWRQYTTSNLANNWGSRQSKRFLASGIRARRDSQSQARTGGDATGTRYAKKCGQHLLQGSQMKFAFIAQYQQEQHSPAPPSSLFAHARRTPKQSRSRTIHREDANYCLMQAHQACLLPSASR